MPTPVLSPSDVLTLMHPKRNRSRGVDNSEQGKQNRTYGGRLYHSLAEMRYAQMLDMRKRAGDIEDWWPQQSIPLRVNGVLVCKMIADFKILTVSREIEYAEVKGHMTDVFRLKLKLLRACYPSVKYTIIPSKEVR